MSELVAFIEARLADDEAVAQAALNDTGARWEYAQEHGAWMVRAADKRGNPGYEYHAPVTHDQEGLSDSVVGDAGPHVARHDPARVLREVAAKRTILAAYVTVAEASERNTAEHTRASAGWPDTQDRIYQLRTHGWQLSGRLEGLEVALRALAAPFSDHPDFQEQWR